MAVVETERHGHILVVRMNRPERLNALSHEMRTRLAETWTEFRRSERFEVAIFTGTGRGFCAGEDMKESLERGKPGGQRPAIEDPFMSGALEKPVIAAVNGPAAGAGLSFACACDVRVASDAATFVPGFVGIGLVPDSGGTWFIHRLLGFARAFEWMCANTRLSAAEALDWGLVSEVIPSDGFASRVAELAAEWAARPTLAVGRTKQLFEHAFAASLEEQLALEAELQQASVGTADFREGVGAFLEKRPPTFTGT